MNNKTFILFVVLSVGLIAAILKFENPNKISTTPKESETTMNQTKRYSEAPKMTLDQAKNYTAVIKTTKGTMTLKLFAKEAPVTANNFVFLARDGYYNETPFHRIVKGFMIQGGDPTGTGRGDPGYKFADEPIARDYKRGILAMANSGSNTNGSQFFIMHADYSLPKNYVIFGQIDPTDSVSLKTLDAIADAPVVDNGSGEVSKPTEQIAIEKVLIEEK